MGPLGRKDRELQGYKQKFDNVGIYRDTNSVGMYKFRVKELLRETKLVLLSMHNLYDSMSQTKPQPASSNLSLNLLTTPKTDSPSGSSM